MPLSPAILDFAVTRVFHGEQFVADQQLATTAGMAAAIAAGDAATLAATVNPARLLTDGWDVLVGPSGVLWGPAA